VQPQPSTTDAFAQIIQHAVEQAVRKALNVDEATNRRLLSVEQAANFLSLSEREIYNIISSRELPAVKHGRRTLLDVRDLDDWIKAHKRGTV
jgi:excisionase family DNA binding protein